ncbi:MAG: CZB domain-containing protein [Thiomargarita sp.]|nr:CZB domain-containing protein [Thiomargarita sp.]
MTKKAFFMRRLNDHIQYLKKLDETLKVSNSEFQGTNHRDCRLGQWIYNEGPAEINLLQNDKANQIFNSLLEPHKQFHYVSNEALEKKYNGDDSGAQSLLTELHILSNTLVNKLLELDSMQ